jgi:GT2 family glycosyltransferase
MSPEISIVIVNYNTPQFTDQCFNSIYQNPPKASYEIVLVDNASSDGSADWLEEQHRKVKIIRSDKNRGIAGGNNLGIRAASGKYILLLNNDTLVKPGAIDRSIEFLEAHPEAGGVGGNLLNEDGSFQSGYAGFHTLGQVFLILTKIGGLLRPCYPSYPRANTLKEVDWMSTAFMTFRKEALEEVGLVDEEYFIYSDETDLQYRLKQKGWKIFYLPELETIHFGGKSVSPWKRRRLVYRGYLLFFHKHRSFLEIILLRLMFIGVCAIKLLFWWVSALIPQFKERAKHEVRSNMDILNMSLKPGVEAA